VYKAQKIPRCSTTSRNAASAVGVDFYWTLPILDQGFFPHVVMINCTLLAGMDLAPMGFPCDSAQACFSTGRVHENSAKKAKSKG
jgi:hypothetical protein